MVHVMTSPAIILGGQLRPPLGATPCSAWLSAALAACRRPLCSRQAARAMRDPLAEWQARFEQSRLRFGGSAHRKGGRFTNTCTGPAEPEGCAMAPRLFGFGAACSCLNVACKLLA